MSGEPLEGIRVVDFSEGWAGPFCTMELGDLGANVVKVESPVGDLTRRLGPPFLAGESLPYLALNRSKRGITLDVASPEGSMVARRLAAWADIVVESFEPGEADALGIGYDVLAESNVGLVYASVTGFGQSGPYRNWAASELVIQLMSGVLESQGSAESAVALGGDPISLFTGKYLLHGILAALIHRQRTGEGQRVDVSMLEASLARTMLPWPQPPSTDGGTVPASPPTRQIWAGTDRSIQVGDQRVEFNFRVDGYTPNDGAWLAFFRDIGAEEMAADARFATEMDRTVNFAALRALLEEHLAAWTAADVVSLVATYGGMAATWNGLGAALAHPQAEALEMVVEVVHPVVGPLRMTAPPYRFDQSPVVVDIPPPTLGQHNIEVLRELGLPDVSITELVEKGVI